MQRAGPFRAGLCHWKGYGSDKSCSRDFLEDTNFYKLTAVYLRNLTNIGLADYGLIIKKGALISE